MIAPSFFILSSFCKFKIALFSSALIIWFSFFNLTAFIFLCLLPDMTNPEASNSSILDESIPISPRRGIRLPSAANAAIAAASPGNMSLNLIVSYVLLMEGMARTLAASLCPCVPREGKVRPCPHHRLNQILFPPWQID